MHGKFVLVGCCLIPIALSAPAYADIVDPDLCSASSGGGSADPPSGRVAITIQSMRLNTDMEVDIWPFDDSADVFGTVVINADGTDETFGLAQIENNNFPHWTSQNRFISRPAIPGTPVHFVIRLREADSLTPDDPVDTSPLPGNNDLEFFLDTCSMRLSGDISGSAADPVAVVSGTGPSQGTLSFKVGMADNRPLSTVEGDVALIGFDLIQVLPERDRLMAGKPTVGLVTVANNTPSPQPVSVHLVVHEASTDAILHESIEAMGAPLEIGEVRSQYLSATSPIVLPGASCSGFGVRATATLILAPDAEPEGPATHRACFQINNSSGSKTWTVIQPKVPRIAWVRVGRLLDVGNLASMTQLNAIHDVGFPFMRDIFPLASVDDIVSPIGFVPPGTLVSDLIVSLLAALGIPADVIIPVILIAELDAMAALVGVDRLMGVLRKDWFNTTLYGLLEGTTGMSLGEWHPHAVIFESVTTVGSNASTISLLPAHELGHTYGLSVDPTIKNWTCSLSGDLGIIACGLTGGFDEYNSADHPNGVPTWGYWLPQGPLPPGLMAGDTGEQCDSSCLMGSNRLDAHLSWASNGQWIDSADYDQLVDKLGIRCGASGAAGAAALGQTAYVSGAIAENDSAYLGWTFHRTGVSSEPDFDDLPGDIPTPYGIVFRDASGKQVGGAELPLSWQHPEFPIEMPVTFFAGHVSFPQGAQRLEIWNRISGKLLAERTISPNRPKVSTPLAIAKADKRGVTTLYLSWDAKDADGDQLTHFVLLSPDGRTWWPAAHALTKPGFSLELPAEVKSGAYVARVLTSDGFNVESRDVWFEF